MGTVELACPDCGAVFEPSDNYCRQCGMYLAAQRTTVAVTRTQTTTGSALVRPQRARAPLPAPVKKAATAVAVGAALQVGLGLAARYLAAQGPNKGASAAGMALATTAARNGRRPARRQPQNSGLPDDIAAVTETVMVSRTWFRKP